MAQTTASNYYLSKQSYRFLAVPDRVTPITDSFDFDESDLYTTSSSPTHSNSLNIPTRKKPAKARNTTASCSLPVNVPDWSKILKSEYKGNRMVESDDDVEDDDEGGVVPPHEILRRRGEAASFGGMMSMTLKGRALSRVRNAIWEKTGFQD